ncbi:MAG TPA: FtsX-like permease family protein [Candidatus Dormibacteraeota bacterium]|nr:FtsX-like permease family protein [Candidatus Dormibacteraeota bacterium]
MSIYFGIPALTVATWMVAAVGVVLLGLLLFAAVNRVLLKMALRNVPRRRAQTVLILFGLMLATLIITASLSVGDTLNYSLQSIQLRQIAGIDEAFTRHPATQYVQGASTANTEFFTEAQAADVIARSKNDTNVAAATGLIAASGSMIDITTSQSSSGNVAVFGVPNDFGSVWGQLHSSSGANLDVTTLAPDEVFVGNSLGDTLNAHAGDRLQLYIDGHLTMLTIRGVLDTEVNPSIANHGPIVNSVLVPLATMRTVLLRPTGYNLIFVHNRGTGGFDDLGPSGVTGDEISRHFRVEFTDPQAAAALWAYVSTPAIKTQIKKIHDQASFLDPTQDLSRRLLVELNQPAVTDEFKALAGNRFVDRVMADAVIAAAGPSDARTAQENLFMLVSVLQVDSAAAAELKALLGQPSIQGPLTAAVLALPDTDPVRQTVMDLFAEVQKPELTAKFKAIVGNPDLQGQLGQAINAIDPTQTARYNDIAERLDLYTYSAYKADAVTFAQTGGLFITAALLGVSFFSIAVGVLLIFLIFVMLAAERRAEMGMSRAVGLKRRHLTQMFLFEGTAYTLAASLVGAALGVGVASLMIRVLSTVFSGFYKGITLTFHFEWTSLVIAICVGILLTFIVVAFSAYRVSRLNIVAAIRDLDESEQRDAGMLSMFVAPFKVAWAAIKQLVHGHPLVFLGRISLGTLGAIRTFWWALFRRGPLTILLGAALVALTLGDSSPFAHIEVAYTAGVSLVIIGTGLLLKWILTLAHVRRLVAARAGFTVAAVGLLLYWGRPFGRVETVLHLESQLQTKQLAGGPEVFIVSALMTLLGAIWLVMYNSDLLISAVMFFTGRISGLAAVTRTSMSYPMSTKFRTGMAVAMFAIVTFIIVYMSVFKDVLVQNFAQVDQVSGGWQIVAGTPDSNFNQTNNTSFPADVASTVQSDPAAAADIRAVGWENQSFGVSLQQVKADGSVAKVQGDSGGYALHVVDDGYLSASGYSLQIRAAGYSSDRAVWDAVRDNTGYVILNASSLDARTNGPADIVGIKPTDSTFQPFKVQVQTFAKGGATPTTWTLTVVGFMRSNAQWGGVYASTRTAMESGLFAAPSPPGTTGPAIGTALPSLTPTGYYFAIKPGVDVNKARLDLGRILVKNQLEPVIVADQLAQQLSGILTLLNLVTGFLALGLIVGIAGLGVISTRAVVERFQQIGMLRALGYRRSRVQQSFLMESSLIAILGLIIGTLVGVWQSYRFFVVDKTFGTVDFHVPIVQIGLILIGAYLATLVTTFLPARSASRIAPAEALRYE